MCCGLVLPILLLSCNAWLMPTGYKSQESSSCSCFGIRGFKREFYSPPPKGNNESFVRASVTLYTSLDNKCGFLYFYEGKNPSQSDAYCSGTIPNLFLPFHAYRDTLSVFDWNSRYVPIALYPVNLQVQQEGVGSFGEEAF